VGGCRIHRSGRTTVELKSIAMILLGLALYVPILAQEHAPLLATCEADVALWYNAGDFTEYDNAQALFFTSKTPNKTQLNRLSVVEVIARHEEMGKCYLMTGRDIYHTADNAYMGIYHDRETDFMVRHNLMNQFRAEDAEGKR
jgi:hypothetical protein